MKLGQIQAAIDDGLKILSIEPKHSSALLLLGDAYLKLGKKSISVQYFEAFLKIKPDHPRAQGIKSYLEGKSTDIL